MRKSERAEIIRKELKKLYPSPPITLDHSNAYTLLVAVVLSAQSTDKKVNELTKSLFKDADNPEKMMKLGINGIYEYIKYLGLSNQKSKNIYNLSKILIETLSFSNFETLTITSLLSPLKDIALSKRLATICSILFSIPFIKYLFFPSFE